MIYISSQGGCKGDMCPSCNSSRLNSANSVFYDRRLETPKPTRKREACGFHCRTAVLHNCTSPDALHVVCEMIWDDTMYSLINLALDWLCSIHEAFHILLIHYPIRHSAEISDHKALPAFPAWFGNCLCIVVITICHVVNHFIHYVELPTNKCRHFYFPYRLICPLLSWLIICSENARKMKMKNTNCNFLFCQSNTQNPQIIQNSTKHSHVRYWNLASVMFTISTLWFKRVSMLWFAN